MIYIAAHKKFDVPRLENYVPLQVGAEGKALALMGNQLSGLRSVSFLG